MDGEMWVESTPGVGSSFYFTARFGSLPDETPCRPMVPDSLRQLRVLVIEDNPTTLLVIERLISTTGFRTDSASTAEQGLALYERAAEDDPFGLILMDIRLPGMDGITAAERIRNHPHIPPPRIIIASAYGREREILRAKEIGAEGYLVKPVRQSLLLDTILEVFGYAPPAPERGIPSSAEELSDASLLLVEDHPINRRVATELLEMVGFSVDVAVNGIEAVEAVRQKEYHAVLMDVQMPKMDGIEATRRIRGWEKETRHSKQETGKSAHQVSSQIPIIAMTAHVMDSDRKKCLDAGMNDYVSKPIDAEELFAVLKNNLPHFKSGMEIANHGARRRKHPRTPPRSPIPSWENQHPKSKLQVPGLNVAEGLERLGNSWPTYMDVLRDFCENQDELADLERRVRKRDFETAGSMAHGLKGAAGNVGAIDLSAAANALEEACGDEDGEHLPFLFSQVEEAYAQVFASFEKLSKTILDQEKTAEPLDETPAPQASSSSTLSELFQKLDTCLQEFDPVSSDACIREIRATFSQAGTEKGDIKNQMEYMENQIRAYNFDRAREALKRMRLEG